MEGGVTLRAGVCGETAYLPRRNRSRTHGRRVTAHQDSRAAWWAVRLRSALAAAPDLLLHPSPPGERPWKLLAPVLALAFVARAAVALSGDFVLHPDEVMQYLEPAHRLVFGNGVTYWEYFYGARSWLVPGLVAAVLKLFDALGLGQPAWYVGGVELVFCAISVLIPAGMYFFARWHFGETTARVALVMGAFWYELVGFAHKPMTEFVATALLLSVLALSVRPDPDRPRVALTAAALVVLAAAIRVQYAPLALLVLGLVFWRTTKKLQLALTAALVLLAVGVLDAMTWGGGLFHSYVTYARLNLALDELIAGASPAWEYLYWLVPASAGLAALCMLAASMNLRRYALLLLLVFLVLLVHSTQSLKAYRFIFAVIPLYLMVGADVLARLASRARAGGRRPLPFRAAAVVLASAFAVVSAAGILNALPHQASVYLSASGTTGRVAFLRAQDPVFAVYRHLAESPAVSGVWHEDRAYYDTPGYYHLHRAIPLYDAYAGRRLFVDDQEIDMEMITASVSHVVTAEPTTRLPGYSVERTFGDIRILRRDGGEAGVRRWREYTPTIDDGVFTAVMRRLYPEAPAPPPNSGIRFVDENPEAP